MRSDCLPAASLMKGRPRSARSSPAHRSSPSPKVRAGLHLVGSSAGLGWAGDMFVSLDHNLGSLTSILPNQPGLEGGNPAGFGYDGWNVVFRDGAANGDIHHGQPATPATLLTGEWQPDGRQDPLASSRLPQLDVFYGAAANASWHLSVADLAPEGTMKLESWSLTFTGTTVPEPIGPTALVVLGLVGFAVFRRRR